MAVSATDVQKAYLAYFGRPADPVGLTYWMSSDSATMKAGFAASAEYAALYTGLTDVQRVQQVYTNLLGRDPDVTGLLYWSAELAAGRETVSTLVDSMQANALGGDITTIANRVTYATAFTAALDTVDEIVGYSGTAASDAARLAVRTVVDTETSLTTAQTALDTSISTVVAAGTTTTGTTFTLTSGADVISGTNNADVITGGNGTLSTLDEINGGAGTDSLTVTFSPSLATAASGLTAAPVISGVEIITLTNNAESAHFDMTNVYGVTSLTLGGRAELHVSAMALTAVSVQGMSAQLSLDLATATAATAAYGLTLNASGSSAADLIWADDSGSTALVDTLTLNAQTNWGNVTSATNFSGVEKLVIQGAGNVTLGMASGIAGGMSADAFADLTANNTAAGIDASGLSGNLTVRLDAAGDFNIKGGAGADTFSMTANLNTNDTLDGGAGSDTLNAVMTGGYIRPVISNVEILNLQGNATAATADFRDVSGATTLNLMLATGLVVDKLQTAVSTITMNSSDGAAGQNALTLQYGTAAAASDVTLNLSNGVQGIFQTAAATATAMALGNFTMSGNSGSLTIKANSTANWAVDAVVLSDVTAVTIDAASGSMTLSAVGMGTAADTITLQAAAGKAIVVAGAMSAMGADTVSFNAAGQSALIDLSAVNVGTANTLTITTDSAGTGGTGFSAVELNFQSAAAATGAVNLDTVTINALGGDVVIGCAQILSGATAINLSIGVTLGGTAVCAVISDLTIDGIATAATASEQNVNLTLSGTGEFKLSSANITTANLTFAINSTGLASGSNVVIDLSNVNATSTVSAVFGAHSGSFIGGDGADRIELGLGAVTVNGGLGADQITFSNTANSVVEMSVGTNAGVDTLIGAAAGDVVLFSAARTATGAASGGSYLNSAWNTGTATDTAQIATASFSAQATATGMTAVKQLAIYTSNGDTIIEALGGSGQFQITAAEPATASDDFVRIVISNKDFTAITAAFRINTTGSGLSVTLL